jgi:hypothetical protein
MLALVTCLGLTVPWLRRRRQRIALGRREPLDDDAIFDRFYASAGLSKSMVRELWHEVADALKVPYTLLRPQDRFGRDIGANWTVSDSLDSLAARAYKRLGTLNTNFDVSTLETVDDYVRRLGFAHQSADQG